MGIPRVVALHVSRCVLKLEQEERKGNQHRHDRCRALLTRSKTFDVGFLVFFILSAVELYPEWEIWTRQHLPRNEREANALELARTRKQPAKKKVNGVIVGDVGDIEDGVLDWTRDRPIPTDVSQVQMLPRASLRPYLYYGKYSSEGAAREWSTVVIVIVIFIS